MFNELKNRKPFTTYTSADCESMERLRARQPILTAYCEKHGLNLQPGGSTIYDLLEVMIQDLERHS